MEKRKRKINKIKLLEAFSSDDERDDDSGGGGRDDDDDDNDNPILKVADTKYIKKKGNNISKYPLPPKPKPVAKRSVISDAVEADIDNVFNNVAIDVNPTVHCPPGPSTSGCDISKQFEIQQSHLMQLVTDLSKEMIELNKKLELPLLGHSGATIHPKVEDEFVIPDFLTNLPVEDDASFSHFNEQLTIIDNKQAIVKFLDCIDGKNVRIFITRLLRRILLDEVAELYSITGKQMKNSSKKPFINTEIYKVVIYLCKSKYQSVTEDNVKSIIDNWLNQAKVRKLRREERNYK